MKRLRGVLYSVAMLAFAGCHSSAMSPSTLPAVVDEESRNVAASSPEYLFAATSSSVREYAPGAKSPMRTLKNYAEYVGLDRSGTLYAASFDEGKIWVYAPGSRSLERTIVTTAPQSMAFDANGNLYVANSGAYSGCPPNPPVRGRVDVYSTGGTLVRSLPLGSAHASYLAFDAAGQLFAATYEEHASPCHPLPTITFSHPSIRVYAPDATTPSSTIAGGLDPKTEPGPAAVDSSGNLYLVNSACPNCPPQLLRYAPGATKPTQSIALTYPVNGMTIGPNDQLYAIQQVSSSSCSVAVFDDGSLTLQKTLPVRIPYCESIVAGQSGDLYVLGIGKNRYADVQIVSPGGGRSSAPFEVVGALSIAVGPE